MKLSVFLVSILVLSSISCKEESTGAQTQPTEESAMGGFVEVAEPHKSSSFQLDEGMNVYKVTCAVCHGPRGLGDGVAGRALKPAPRNLIEGKWTKGGDSISLFKTVTHGISGTSMAGFKQLPIEKRWAVVHYIRSITKNKVKDDPKKVDEFAKSAE